MILLLTIKNILFVLFQIMFYSKPENVHNPITKQLRDGRRWSWEDNVALHDVRMIQHADQGGHGPQSLRTGGWSQPVKLIKDKDLPQTAEYRRST